MKKIEPRFQVSPYNVFFLVHSLQIGVGILGYQTYIAKDAGYDAWISIIIAGLGVHILIYLIYKMMSGEKAEDLYSIHTNTFGKVLGSILCLFFIVYFFGFSLVVFRTYIEVVQVWMFQDLKVWVFAPIILLLMFYTIAGGFRTIAGICFFGVVLPIYLIFMLGYPLKYSYFGNLLPVLSHSPQEILLSAKAMTLNLLGFELLLMYLPFIKNVEKSQKWAHLGALFSTLIYLIIAIVTFAYFSEGYLEKTMWPSLSMFKIVSMPFVERFEYIAIATWMLIILPNVCLALWAATRLSKQIFKIKQKHILILFLIILYIISIYLQERTAISKMNDIMSNIGFYLLVAYIPFLFVISKLKKKVVGQK